MDENTQNNSTDTRPEETRTSPLSLAAMGLGAALLVGVGILYGVTRSQVKAESESAFTLKAAGVFQIPAASINGNKILYSDFVGDKNALKDFFAKNPDAGSNPTEAEVADMALSRLINNAFIEDIAREFNVTVTAEEIKEKELILQNNLQIKPEELPAKIKEIYNLGYDAFVERVIKPLILEEKLQTAINQSTNSVDAKYQQEERHARHILFKVDDPKKDAEIKKKAEEVLARVKKGEDFAALAKEFGSDGTKDLGGDLGWFARGVMVKPFEDAVFALEPGQIGDLVKTEFGYHIIKLEEKRSAVNFQQFMLDRFKAASLKKYVNVELKDIETVRQGETTTSTTAQ